MMPEPTFDEAIPATVRAVEAAGLDLRGCTVTVLRDLLGRLRLHVTRPAAPTWPGEAKRILKEALTRAAGPYATGTVFVDDAASLGRSFPAWETVARGRRPLEVRGTAPVASWLVFERRFSKDAWIEEPQTEQEPWKLEGERPATVISFYAFKGGVGRTTALAAFALFLAAKGKSVLVIDLDLESPGIGSLLLGPKVEPDLGVVDFLVEARVQRSAPLSMSRFALVSPFATAGGSLRVIPAGRLDSTFLEKLGRIDMQGLVQPELGARRLLHDLLGRARQELKPDAILLDVRAGLHDLGGISLAGLSHLELIFAVHSDQTWSGFPLLLGHLGRLRADWVRLVHCMIPPVTRSGEEVHKQFVSRAYEQCSQHYYLEDEVPAFEAEEATHNAYRLPFREALMGVSDLGVGASALLADEHRAFCEALARDAGLA